MTKRRQRSVPEHERRVVGLYKGARQRDVRSAQTWLDTAIANGAARGIAVSIVGTDGETETRIFGRMTKGECVWVGAVMLDYGRPDTTED